MPKQERSLDSGKEGYVAPAYPWPDVVQARLLSCRWSTLPVGETATAVGRRRTVQCIAFGVYEKYAWAWWEDVKQDILREEKIRHRRDALGLSEGQVTATSSAQPAEGVTSNTLH